MKKFFLSFSKIVFLLSLTFFYSCFTVSAIKVINQGEVGKNASSSGSGCASGEYQGCYNGKIAGYRVTLIDKDGKIINGTHSVDIFNEAEGSFNMLDTHELLYPNVIDKIKNGTYSSGIPNRDKFVNYDHPRYKYGVNTKDIANLVLNNRHDGPVPSSDLTEMKAFIDKIKNYVENDQFDESGEMMFPEWKLYYGDDKSELVRVNFLDLFLYYSGYLDLKKITFEKHLLTDYKGSNIYNLFTDSQNPIYMILEPTYFVDFNLIANKITNPRAFAYGTFSELMLAMEENPYNGLMYGFGHYLPWHHGCDLSTNNNVQNGLPLITKSVNNSYGTCSLSLGSSSYFNYANANNYNMIFERTNANAGYGYGVFVINITDSIGDNPPVECNDKFCLNYCSSNDGIVSFKPGKTISNAELKNSQIFWENPEADVNSRISCYDTVEYNFTNVMDSMRATKRVLTYLDVPSGYAYVTRRCWVGENATAPKIQDIFDEYKISGNFQMAISAPKGKNGSTDYGFIVESIDELKQPTPVRYQDGNIYEYKLNLKYTTSPILLYSKPDRTSQKTSIFFKENAFGASNKIINNPLSDVSFVDAWGTDATRDQINDGMRCYFDMNFISGSIKFRTISLENPFPARDGTSRLPGTNWLYEDNYVFDYITNNRGVRYAYASNHGLFDLETNSCTDCDKVTFITDRTASSQDKINVSPEAIYTELEPMYSVTLTPSTMLKIRGYNKAHQYTSMYLDSTVDYMTDKLSCVDGRECYSPFLRDDSYIPNDSISGTCFFSKEEDMRNPRFNYSAYGYITKELEKENYDYIGGYDFNKNLIFDSTDAQIAESVSGNHSKLTDFYYCANKTYLSGGPEDYGSVVRGDGE